MTAAPIVITADEINCLIYSYFQDAGFNHSAFALRNEGRLQNSSNFSKHIPRGELIELLSKALLYLEVESHWRGDELATTCKSGFSLLEPHVCSMEPPSKSTDIDTPMDDVNSAAMSGVVPTTSTSQSYATSQPTKNGQAPDRKTTGKNDTSTPSELLVHERGWVESQQSLTPTVDSAPKRKTSPVPLDGHVDKRPRRASIDMEAEQHERGMYMPLSRREQGPGDDTDPRIAVVLKEHKTEVFVCAFNPRRPNLLASGSKDSIVNLWDLPDPPQDGFSAAPGTPVVFEKVSTFEHADLTSLDWNSDGTLLAIGSYDSILRVCNVDGSVYFSHPQHQGPIFATRFSKNGQWLLSASLDGTTCLWDVKEKRLHKQYRNHRDCCLDVEWITADTFASCGADQRIFIMRVDEDEAIKVFNGHKDEVNQIKVNRSGTRLASCSDDGTAAVWRVDNIKSAADEIPGLSSASAQVVILKGHCHSVSTVGWCNDQDPGTNEMVATSSFDGTARLWDSVTGECHFVFRDHRRPLYSLEFSPDGRFLATGSGDGWLHLYHTKSHARLFSWFAGVEKPGVFEIDWQMHDGINRIVLALECRQVAVIDVSKIPAFKQLTDELQAMSLNS